MARNDYPQAAVNNAKRALKWAEENGWGSCGTEVGKRRARQLASKSNISDEVIVRTYSYLSRAAEHADVPYSEGCGGLMYDAWGGKAMLRWAAARVKEMDEERNQQQEVEKRTRTMEVRASGPMVLEGYAALFDEETDLGAFKERIARGAFDDVLDNDVRLLMDHEPPPLARTTNGTLQLSVDDKGLKYRAELVDTQAARDLYTMVKRGDINQSSFAFTIAEQEFDNERELRTVTKVQQLFDVSPVTYPAYQATSVAARKKDIDTPVEKQASTPTEEVTLRTKDIHMNFKNSTDAQQHIHSLEQKLDSIQSIANGEERALTAEELEETQDIHAKLEAAEEQRNALAKNEARIKRMAATGSASTSEQKELKKVGDDFNLLRALNAAAHGRALDGAEAEMMQEAQREASSMGLALRGNVALPQSYLQMRNVYGNDSGQAGVNDAVTTTGTVADAVREALRPQSVIQNVGATQLTGFVGDIKLPTLPNDSASTPAEGADATAFTAAMQSVTLTPQRYAAEITVTKEALNQATGNMQQVIARDFGVAIGNQIDRVAFKNIMDQGGTLTGGTLALGATAGDSRAQSEASIILATESGTNDLPVASAADVARLWGDITGNGVAGGTFVMHPTTASVLFNTNTTGDGGAPVLANGQIYGHNVVTAGTFPRLDIDAAKADQFLNGGSDVAFGDVALCGAILYGDWSNVFWATWGGLSLTVDPFSGVSAGTVKIVADQFFDVKLRTPDHMGFMLVNDSGATIAGADA
jgi:uncharacterized protein